jgi:hypothetical protein
VLQTKDHQVGSNTNNNNYNYYSRKSSICTRLFKKTRSGAKPRRRPIAASASCATAMGKKPSEIRQKNTRPKRKPFSPRKTAFSGEGGELFMPTFAKKDRKVPEKKLGFTPPHFTLGVKANCFKGSIVFGKNGF